MKSTMKITGYFVDDEGYDCEEEFEVPCKKEVCWRCGGKGVHDHEAFSNGISTEELYEDPDFAEDYFQGAYDVVCSECHGVNVLDVPDLDSCSEHVRQAILNKEDIERQIRAEEAAERRLGC